MPQVSAVPLATAAANGGAYPRTPFAWTGAHCWDGYADEMLLDARTDHIFFGRNQAE